MNPRSLIHFCKSPTGRFLGFLLAGGMVLFLLRGCPSRPGGSTAGNTPPPSGHTPETFTRPMSPLPPLSQGKPAPPATAHGAPPPAEVSPSLSLYSAPPAAVVEPEWGPDYLPFGRLIRCELVITVDSARIATPIIGLVTEDVYRDGRIIIPVGTEVHGRAQTDRARDRISSDSTWVIVWPGGEELAVTGLALDQVREPAGLAVTDGSAGIQGQFMKADHLAELKLFAAAFLSGATGLLQERQPSLIGSLVLPKTKNAALSGANEVVDAWSRQLAERILDESHFVRCPAGKAWYLYTTQAIDKSKATRAGSRLHSDVRRLQTVESRADEASVSTSRLLPGSISLHSKNP